MTRTKRFAGLIYGALCAANAAAYGFHLIPPQDISPVGYATLHLAMPVLLPLIWGLFWLVLRLCDKKHQPPEPATTQYFDASLLTLTAWMAALDLYILVYLPLTQGEVGGSGYYRMLLVVSGLIFAGFGNIVPRQPYQRMRSWLEIGPERSYRLNRICGWIMVAVGLFMVVTGLTVHPDAQSFAVIFALSMAAVLVPYCILQYRSHRAWQRENGLP